MSKRSLFVLAFVFGIAAIALGQTDTGRVIGTISDASGAVIDHATVNVTNTGTARNVTAETNDSGQYVLNALPAGKYHVEIRKDGFKTATVDFTLEVSQVQEISLKLETGEVTTTVDVTSGVPLVDTATSSMGEVIQGNQITELPLNGRNFTQLALLTPGVTRGAYGSQASGIGNQAETFRYAQTGGAALSANGLRQQANNFILDGLDNNEGLVNTINIFPPVEATEEFRVDTSVAPAEFGRAGGAIVDSSLKSGTNQFHGTAFDFLRNSALDANSVYFNPITNGKPTPKSPFKRNQFGGTIGGPIIKNKLFVFGDFQGLRSDQPQNPQITTVPTPLMRQGNFSELLGAGLSGQMSIPACVTNPAFYTVGSNGNKVNSAGYVFDPVTCTPFGWNGTTATNIIPAGLI